MQLHLFPSYRCGLASQWPKHLVSLHPQLYRATLMQSGGKQTRLRTCSDCDWTRLDERRRAATATPGDSPNESSSTSVLALSRLAPPPLHSTSYRIC